MCPESNRHRSPSSAYFVYHYSIDKSLEDKIKYFAIETRSELNKMIGDPISRNISSQRPFLGETNATYRFVLFLGEVEEGKFVLTANVASERGGRC